MTEILVVEDEPGIALGFEDDLRLEGYDVEVIGNGATATRRARECALARPAASEIWLHGSDSVVREYNTSGEGEPL